MRKGFTLVELLAVIVILAVLALITVPLIINVVESSKKSTAESSAYGYIEGINLMYANELLLGNNFELDGTLLVDEKGLLDGHKVEVEGTIAKGGYLIYKDSKIKEGCLEINEYKVNIENDKVNKTEKGKCGEVPYVFGGKVVNKTENDTHKGIVYLDPTDLTKKCNVELASKNINEYGTPTRIKEGCMKWYIYDDEGDKYKMILDHNTTPTVFYNSVGTNEEMKEVQEALDTDTSNWDSRIKSSARLITANEIAEITGNIDWNSETAIDTNWFYFESNSHYNKCDKNSNGNPVCSPGESSYAWLFDYSYSCLEWGCNIEDSNIYVYNSSSDVAKIWGYWTSSGFISNPKQIWYVTQNGVITVNWINRPNAYGLRPVIEIDKSLLS